MLTPSQLKRRSELRQRARSQRRSLSWSQRQKAAALAKQRLACSPEFLRAKHIALYWQDDGEVPTLPIIQLAWSRGKKVYLPHLDLFKRMHFVELQPGDKLAAGKFGLLSPGSKRRYSNAVAIDLIIAPLVAFDLKGNRLGRGGGYYDKLLHRHKICAGQRMRKPYFLGLAYSFQQTEHLPSAKWDMHLDAAVTESHFLYF